jgi:hypothetical protein
MPPTCTCILSVHGMDWADAVTHFSDCALMTELENLVSERFLPASYVKDAEDPFFYIGENGSFYVNPGVSGDTRCAF